MEITKNQKNAFQKTGVFFLLLLAACSSPPPTLGEDPLAASALQNSVTESANKPLSPPASGAIQPGFLYEISEINDRGMGGKFRVDFDGKLRLSYNVVIDTEGLQESSLREKVIESFKPFLKSVNSIHVALTQRKIWLDLRGLVAKPGRYLADPEASLDEVLNMAGGIPANSQAEYLQIQKKDEAMAISLTDYYDTGNASRIPKLQGGEVLFVQRKNDLSTAMLSASHPVIEMLGEVKAPGEIPFRGDEDFLYYLTKSGGPSAVADLSKIEVIRLINGKRVSATYNWEQSHQITRLFPRDIVVIHATQQTPLERALQSGAAIGAILSAIGILIIAL